MRNSRFALLCCFSLRKFSCRFPHFVRHLIRVVLLLPLGVSPLATAEQTLTTDFQDVQPKYIRTGNKFNGICIDILKGLNKRLSHYGYIILFPNNFTPIKRIRANLYEGTTDLHCGAARTEEREKTYAFSEKPLYDIKTVMVGRADSPFNIQSMDDLVASKGRLSAVYGTNTHKFISSLNNVTLGPIPKEPFDGLLLVGAGRTDFFVYHDIGIKYMIKMTNKNNSYKIQPYIFRHYQHWMMYSPNLNVKIRKIIEFKKIYNLKLIFILI